MSLDFCFACLKVFFLLCVCFAVGLLFGEVWGLNLQVVIDIISVLFLGFLYHLQWCTCVCTKYVLLKLLFDMLVYFEFRTMYILMFLPRL